MKAKNLRGTTPAARKATQRRGTASGSVKPTRGLPFKLTLLETGEKLMEGLVMIVSDGTKKVSRRGLIPGLPKPILIERTRFACLIREWRNHPEVPKGSRNFPTVGELMAMKIRRGLQEQLSSLRS